MFARNCSDTLLYVLYVVNPPNHFPPKWFIYHQEGVGIICLMSVRYGGVQQSTATILVTTCLWLFVYQLIVHKLNAVPTIERNMYLVVITIFLLYFIKCLGYVVAQLVRALHYNQKGCGFNF